MKAKEFNILLIEPYITSNKIEKLLLQQIPQVNKVVCITNPVVALNLIYKKDSNFSLIITTANNNKLNGFDFISNLKKFGFENIPVILISTDSTLRKKALENGAFDFLEKPLDFEKLKEIITHLASFFV